VSVFREMDGEGGVYLSSGNSSTSSAIHSLMPGLQSSFHVPAGFRMSDSWNHCRIWRAAFGSSRKTDSVRRTAPPWGKSRSHAKREV